MQKKARYTRASFNAEVTEGLSEREIILQTFLYREFMIVLYVMSSGTPQENLKQIFRVFDINNDGSISAKELKRIVKDLFHLLSKEDNPDKASQDTLAELAFKEMDADFDGKITEQEFVSACMGQEKISSMLALRIIDVFVAD